uniref:Uncharacterized protein n=1 Tax=Vitis vinifera TaxID=29760 RepID=A5BNE6_VITVI|nr:hypothetical protein VITISV_028332 [Vitis vinifera]
MTFASHFDGSDLKIFITFSDSLCFPLMGSNTKSLSLIHLAMARASHLTFAIQGEFGDLDIKYLKQNIPKYRPHISGSFRRTPRHCAKNGCETLRVEWRCSRIQDVIHPDGMRRAPLSGLPQGEAHDTRDHHTPNDSISYPDMLFG